MEEPNELQDPTTIEKDIASVLEFYPIIINNLDMPETFLFVPVRSRNSMLELHVFLQVVFHSDILEILPNLW